MISHSVNSVYREISAASFLAAGGGGGWGREVILNLLDLLEKGIDLFLTMAENLLLPLVEGIFGCSLLFV